MTPDRLSGCLQLVRWNSSTLAEALDVPADRVTRWTEGREDIPKKIASWIEALCFVHEAAEESKPSTPGAGFDQSFSLEHIPIYAYETLRTLHLGPVELKHLFGSDNDAAVFFLISRGLAVRRGANLIITPEGRLVGEIAFNNTAETDVTTSRD